MLIHPLNQYSRYHGNKNQKSEIEKEEKVDATEENVSKRKRDHSELSDDEESYKKLRYKKLRNILLVPHSFV